MIQDNKSLPANAANDKVSLSASPAISYNVNPAHYGFPDGPFEHAGVQFGVLNKTILDVPTYEIRPFQIDVVNNLIHQRIAILNKMNGVVNIPGVLWLVKSSILEIIATSPTNRIQRILRLVQTLLIAADVLDEIVSIPNFREIMNQEQVISRITKAITTKIEIYPFLSNLELNANTILALITDAYSSINDSVTLNGNTQRTGSLLQVISASYTQIASFNYMGGTAETPYMEGVLMTANISSIAQAHNSNGIGALVDMLIVDSLSMMLLKPRILHTAFNTAEESNGGISMHVSRSNTLRTIAKKLIAAGTIPIMSVVLDGHKYMKELSDRFLSSDFLADDKANNAIRLTLAKLPKVDTFTNDLFDPQKIYTDIKNPENAKITIYFDVFADVISLTDYLCNVTDEVRGNAKLSLRSLDHITVMINIINGRYKPQLHKTKLAKEGVKTISSSKEYFGGYITRTCVALESVCSLLIAPSVPPDQINTIGTEFEKTSFPLLPVTALEPTIKGMSANKLALNEIIIPVQMSIMTTERKGNSYMVPTNPNWLTKSDVIDTCSEAIFFTADSELMIRIKGYKISHFGKVFVPGCYHHQDSFGGLNKLDDELKLSYKFENDSPSMQENTMLITSRVNFFGLNDLVYKMFFEYLGLPPMGYGDLLSRNAVLESLSYALSGIGILFYLDSSGDVDTSHIRAYSVKIDDKCLTCVYLGDDKTTQHPVKYVPQTGADGVGIRMRTYAGLHKYISVSASAPIHPASPLIPIQGVLYQSAMRILPIIDYNGRIEAFIGLYATAPKLGDPIKWNYVAQIFEYFTSYQDSQFITPLPTLNRMNTYVREEDGYLESISPNKFENSISYIARSFSQVFSKDEVFAMTNGRNIIKQEAIKSRIITVPIKEQKSIGYEPTFVRYITFDDAIQQNTTEFTSDDYVSKMKEELNRVREKELEENKLIKDNDLQNATDKLRSVEAELLEYKKKVADLLDKSNPSEPQP